MFNDSNLNAQRKSAVKKFLNSEVFDYIMIAIGMMGYGMGWTVTCYPTTSPQVVWQVCPPCCTGAWGFQCR